jgi:amino-acid N-acetyltransferase
MAGIRGLIRLYPAKLVQANLPRASSFFVAEADGPEGKKIVGCAALQVYSKRMAELRSLAVAPEFRERGVGSRLVDSCTARARERGVREVFAVTSQVRLFERLGFTTFRRERIGMFYEVSQPAKERE